MAVFIHSFFFTFSIYLSGWTGQAFISLPNPVMPVDHLHHVLTLLILTLKCRHHVSSNIVVATYKNTRYHHPADHSLMNVSSSIPSHYNFNMSPLLSPFFQVITEFIVSGPRSS